MTAHPSHEGMRLFLLAHERARRYGRTVAGRDGLVAEMLVSHRDTDPHTIAEVARLCDDLQKQWRRK